MDLLLVRHGVAEDRAYSQSLGVRDALRPLTDRGRAKMKQVARGLATSMDPPDALFTSPLVRATETAEILGKALGRAAKETRTLAPEAPPSEFFRVLAGCGVSRVVAVGHEPHLTSFIAASLGLPRNAAFVLKKGGACLLRFDRKPAPGSGVLLWLATSGMLRRMGP